MGISGALRRKGVVSTAKPARLVGGGFDTSTEVGLTVDGRLVLHHPGGLFGNARFAEVDPASCELREADGALIIADGPVNELRLETEDQSLFHRALLARGRGEAPEWSPGPDWTPRGGASAVALYLADDPRTAPRGATITRGSGTLWRSETGWRIDSAHGVFDVLDEHVLAVECAGATWEIHVQRPTHAGVLVAVKLTLAPGAELERVGSVPEARLSCPVVGATAGDRFRGVGVVRTQRELLVLGEEGRTVARMPLAEVCWSLERRVLLATDDVWALVDLDHLPQTQWFFGALRRDDTLVQIQRGEHRAVGWAHVEDSALHATGSEPLPLAGLSQVEMSEDGDLLRLGVGDVVLRGHVEGIGPLRSAVGAHVGRDALRTASIAELVRTWHELRTERWLWLAFGPIVLTDRLLEEASTLPAEEGDDEETTARRRVVTETLIVADQVRAVRLRLGAAPTGLPYSLLDEEAEWLDALLDGDGADALEQVRPKILGGFRARLRDATANLGFAVADIERAVARLEPVHRPELRGEQSMWGRLGLGAAMMLLSPVSGTITIASTLVGKVTEHASKDAGSRGLIDHFGPQCKSGWDLLLDVTAVCCIETRLWLRALWAELAARDRELLAHLDDQARDALLRPILLERIETLRGQRFAPLPGRPRDTIAVVTEAMLDNLEPSARELIESLSGQTQGRA